jgi:hypothetical protein
MKGMWALLVLIDLEPYLNSVSYYLHVVDSVLPAVRGGLH